jgi:hypothetical protein
MMTPRQFVAAVKTEVFDPAVGETALQPRGRRPHPGLVAMWDWYSGLSGRDKALVCQVMRIAAYGSVFGFFAVLDGARAIDDVPHGELELTYVDPRGNRVQLNVPHVEELHTLWTEQVFPYTEPLPD